MNIGDHVGDYEVIEILGKGGMGQVCKVKNLLSERVEAMKMLLPNVEGDAELAERFQREIKVQAALDHPNIAKFYTALRADNHLFMLMEFVDGSSVEKILTKGPLLAKDAADYAGQVLDALAYAHSHGVVHRDIKPANMMLTPAGVIKLLDFGIARMTADAKITKPGSTLGSLYYMSPEQIQGTPPDPRSDLYSLGIVLYEMVTGKRPFQGDTEYKVMAGHLNETPVPPIDLVPWTLGPLNEIILMAISKNPDNRFQTAEAFRAALKTVAASAPSMSQTQGMKMAATAAIATAPMAVPQSVPPAGTAATTPAGPQQTAATATPPPPAALPDSTRVQGGTRMEMEAQPMQTTASQMVPPQAQPQSRRGLYMALGSIVTLGVLVAAAIEGPKFFKSRADQPKTTQSAPAPAPAPQTTSQSTTASTEPTIPIASEPGSSSGTAPVQQSLLPGSSPITSSGSSGPSAGGAASASSSSPASGGGAATTGGQPSNTSSTSGSATPVKHAPGQGANGQGSASGQGSTTQRDSAAGKTEKAQAAGDSAASAKTKELIEPYSELSVRAATAKSGLRSLKQQMASQGLGLRSDIVEAEARMEFRLAEAKRAIAAGDAENAQRNLDMAQHAIETIEKFLGH